MFGWLDPVGAVTVLTAVTLTLAVVLAHRSVVRRVRLGSPTPVTPSTGFLPYEKKAIPQLAPDAPGRPRPRAPSVRPFAA